MQYVKFRKNGEVYLELMNWNLWWGCRDGVCMKMILNETISVGVCLLSSQHDVV